MISLIMLGSIINYLTRSTLSVAAPTLLEELHISAKEYSSALSRSDPALLTRSDPGILN